MRMTDEAGPAVVGRVTSRHHSSRVVALCGLVALSFPFAIHANRPDAVVTFNEVMYHPVNDEENLEWIEFHNQFAVDVDLSGWSICNGVFFIFPVGTVVPGGGHVVVAANPAALASATGFDDALGPFIGRLDNSGERLELCNNNGRIMDTFRFRDEDDWPVGPDGSGLTLAKIDPDTAAKDASSWTQSTEMGGTPGAPNFPDGDVVPPTARLAINEIFAPPAGGGWLEVINHGEREIALDGYVLRTSGPIDGEYTFLPRSLAAGEHFSLTAAELGFDLILGNKLFLLPPALDEVVDAAEVKGDLRGRHPEGVGRWLFPDRPTPGATNRFDFHDEIVINEIMYHPRVIHATPAVVDPTLLVPIESTWRYEATGSVEGENWKTSEFDDLGWPEGEALFYNESSSLPAAKNTPIELGQRTYYFRRSFDFEGDPAAIELQLRPVIDDGAVFYLNGTEILRFNMAAGPVDSETLASASVSNADFTGPYAVSTEALIEGENVLAVEVHQRTENSSDVVFGVEVMALEILTPAQPLRESTESWIELYNRSSTTTIDLTGWRLDRGIDYDFEAGTLLAPGEFIVVAEDQALLRSLFPAATIVGNFTGTLSNRHDLLVLKDDVGNPADEVEYFDGIHWSSHADGGGSSLELRDPDADNSKPGAWAASDESLRSSWRSYSYDKVATTSGPRQPTQWNEFIIGLLDEGEILIDDISVIESPGGAEVQFVSNGTFSSGSTDWRIIGNHRHSEVVPDPDAPGNNVLRLVSTGAQEHMHNHAETTIAGGRATQNGRTYRISYRAKWIGGSNQLNTRLYFNRAAETTLLDVPQSGGTPGAPNSRLESDVGPTYGGFGHAPIVPASGEPVVVSVEADDPDGVASLTLRHSIEDGAFSTVAMSRVGNVWSGSIPGQSAARLVQFYVEGVDGLGATSRWPPAGPESGALYRVDDGLASNVKHTVRVLLPPSDTALLHTLTNVMSNDRMPGTIIYDERRAYYDCGIRLKGSERGRHNPSRLGFNVRFPRYDLFRGAHKGFALDRSGGLLIGGHPGQDEIVTKHIIAHGGGVPVSYEDIIHLLAPRSAQNGSALLQMARFGTTFLDSRYENGSDGTVFELELTYYPRSTGPDGLKIPTGDGVISTDIANHGDDKETYRYNFIIGNNRDKDDYSGVMELGAVFSQSGAVLDTLAPEVMDVDEWLRCFAYQSLCLIGDTYTRGGNNHNFRFYIHPDGNRAIALPWDWDRTLFRSTTQPLWGEANLQKIILRPNNLHRYYGHLLDIIETTFNPTYMNPWITPCVIG